VTHPCSHCEDFKNPVTPENGISVKYPVDGVEIDLYLHQECAEAWSKQFGISLPQRRNAACEDFVPIRVLIADDSPVMRKAVRRLLEIEPGIEIVGEACSFRQMIDMKQQFQPDVVVMDLHMTEESETATDELKNFGSPLIAVSVCDTDEGEPKAREIGATLFLDKMRLSEELVPRIRELALAG
jgi:CheY-like chemotaxis protein